MLALDLLFVYEKCYSLFGASDTAGVLPGVVVPFVLVFSITSFPRFSEFPSFLTMFRFERHTCYFESSESLKQPWFLTHRLAGLPDLSKEYCPLVMLLIVKPDVEPSFNPTFTL